MAFVKKEWKDRASEHPNRRRLNFVSENVYDVTREEGEIVEAGDALNSENLNGLENRIYTGFQNAASNIGFDSASSKVFIENSDGEALGDGAVIPLANSTTPGLLSSDDSYKLSRITENRISDWDNAESKANSYTDDTASSLESQIDDLKSRLEAHESWLTSIEDDLEALDSFVNDDFLPQTQSAIAQIRIALENLDQRITALENK